MKAVRRFVANAAVDGRLRRFVANLCMLTFIAACTAGGLIIAPAVGLFCLAGASFVVGYLLGAN